MSKENLQSKKLVQIANALLPKKFLSNPLHIEESNANLREHEAGELRLDHLQEGKRWRTLEKATGGKQRLLSTGK